MPRSQLWTQEGYGNMESGERCGGKGVTVPGVRFSCSTCSSKAEASRGLWVRAPGLGMGHSHVLPPARS